MAKAKSALSCGCPVAAFQKMISGKYKLRIVWDLKDGPKRYGAIRTGLLRGSDGTSEIAPRVLSRELKALTEAGLIDRKDYGVVPPKVEYRLTRKGKSFVPVIAAIRNWGTRHLAQAGSDERASPHISPVRNGLVSRSWPMLEPAPWPQMKPTSSPSGSSFVVIELISVA
jgi:DNA-binding HxlR family transcriptional regulator